MIPQLPSVLLIDDGMMDLRLILSAVDREKLAYQFKVLRDGEAAANFLLQEKEFAGQNTTAGLRLILLDLRLPKMDGLDVLRIIRSRPNLQTIPVVILSGSSSPADVEKAYMSGANSYLVKPTALEEYRWLIGRLRDYWLGLNVLPRQA